MDEKEQNNLKPEEIFGGFPPDENVFLESQEEESGEIFTAPQTETAGEADAVSEETAEPRVIKIKPQVAEPVVYPKLKQSPWPAFSAVAAVLIILAAAFYFIYNNMSLSNLSKYGITEINRASDNSNIEETEKIIQSDEQITHDKATEAITETDNSTENQIQTDGQSYDEAQNMNSGSDVMPQHKPAPEVEKPIQTQPKPQVIQKPAPDVTKWPEQRIEPEQEKIIQKPEPKSTGVYALEVYSTPSYEDAKDWVDKLSSRKLQAVIIPRKIRDKIIYKVRLGNFSSEEEARKTAINMGLSRSYVDKIR